MWFITEQILVLYELKGLGMDSHKLPIINLEWYLHMKNCKLLVLLQNILYNHCGLNTCLEKSTNFPHSNLKKYFNFDIGKKSDLIYLILLFLMFFSIIYLSNIIVSIFSFKHNFPTLILNWKCFLSRICLHFKIG